MTKKEAQLLIEFIEVAVLAQSRSKLISMSGSINMYSGEDSFYIGYSNEKPNPKEFLKFVKDNYKQIRSVNNLIFVIKKDRHKLSPREYVYYRAYKSRDRIYNIKNKL